MAIFIHVLKRALALLPVMICVTAIVAMLAHIVPGDPVDSILGDYASADQKLILRQRLGLDLSFFAQLGNYFLALLQGDLGQSLVNNRSVAELIVQRFPATLELACCAVFCAAVIGIPCGVLAAVYVNRPVDYIVMGISLLGISSPSFWLGSMLILVFSLKLDLLPVSGRAGWDSYILPSLTMGVALAAVISRMARNSTLDVMKEDFVRTARAKGLSETTVILKHVLRNAALPIVTILGLQFGVVLTGAVISEVIFDWPGMGTLIMEGIKTRDYPVIQGCVLVFSLSYLVVNFLTDICYVLVDPRIKAQG